MPPVKNPTFMTSYGGIIRIRLKGRSAQLPLSLLWQAPLFDCLYFTSVDGKLQVLFLIYKIK